MEVVVKAKCNLPPISYGSLAFTVLRESDNTICGQLEEKTASERSNTHGS